MNNQSSSRKPLFAYSVIRPLSGGAVALLVLILVGISDYLFYHDLGYGLYLLVLGLLVLGPTLRLYSYRVHRAWFFEDHFKISGRGPTKEIRYEEVEGVSKRVVLSLWDPRTSVIVTIRGGQRPVIIGGNPYNRHFKADLYQWLAKKKQSPRPLTSGT